MKIAVFTQLPAFLNDIGDVIRLFYGEGAAVFPESDADAQLFHEHVDVGECWRECFLLRTGEMERRIEKSAPAVRGGLEEKRQLKRLVKNTAYALLKDFTGRKPAWGSLTGIRPTRLFYQQLAAGCTPEEAEKRLIDLFDISEEKVKLLREITEAQKGFLDRDPGRCDLYIGIPFCTTRCSYCSFSSGEIGNGRLVEPYLNSLIAELRAARELSGKYGFKIHTGYIGGGTPTSLSAKQLDRLLDEVCRLFPGLTEWTVEAGRPDTLDEEKLRVLRSYPVTRISINPQTMNDETLRRIGRAHTAADTVRAYERARALGFSDINMDIIAALPGEDLPLFEKTLAGAWLLRPESLTVHTLAVKRSSRLHEQRYQQGGEEAAAMVESARETAHAMGMRAYYMYRQKYMADNLENAGYCLDGHVCRYNIDNMEETTSILACGAGAISKLVPGEGEKIVRVPNLSNIEQYIARVEEMIRRKRIAFGEGGENDVGHIG
ncbi:MAG: coproporphyrinogen dehydrogenase HemZ [Clostridiales bacterium]|nr:coproporphyrinogen dehydrogenase HemZ [Clostridiales bacterium]